MVAAVDDDVAVAVVVALNVVVIVLSVVVMTLGVIFLVIHCFFNLRVLSFLANFLSDIIQVDVWSNFSCNLIFNQGIVFSFPKIKNVLFYIS